MSRSLGRDDITVSTTMHALPVHRTDGTPPIFAGLRRNWMTGEDPESGARFQLDAGAGFGSRYLTMSVTFSDGSAVHEYVDVAIFAEARARAIINERTEQ